MIRVSVFVLIAEQRGVLTRLDRIRIVGTLLSMWSGILYHPPPQILLLTSSAAIASVSSI